MNFFNINGIREIPFGLTKDAVIELQAEWKYFLETVGEFHTLKKRRGIVMCGGGKYLDCCRISINMLRNQGCSLPIELWYLDGELSPEQILEFSKLDVRSINANELTKGNINGYKIKPFSILNSSFDELLFLDADNICLRNPEFLFESKEYKKHGAIFWPDYWETERDNPIWSIMGVRYRQMKEQESGQLVINKEKCWTALNLCMHLNTNSDIYYKLLFGDKDTFRFAWMAVKCSFHFIKTEPATCGYIDNNGNFMGHTMVQYFNESEPLFLHRNLLKWNNQSTTSEFWQLIKRFSPASKERKYKLGYSSDNAHHYMDIVGDITISDFKGEFGSIEEECLHILNTFHNC